MVILTAMNHLDEAISKVQLSQQIKNPKRISTGIIIPENKIIECDFPMSRASRELPETEFVSMSLEGMDYEEHHFISGKRHIIDPHRVTADEKAKIQRFLDQLKNPGEEKPVDADSVQKELEQIETKDGKVSDSLQLSESPNKIKPSDTVKQTEQRTSKDSAKDESESIDLPMEAPEVQEGSNGENDDSVFSENSKVSKKNAAEEHAPAGAEQKVPMLQANSTVPTIKLPEKDKHVAPPLMSDVPGTNFTAGDVKHKLVPILDKLGGNSSDAAWVISQLVSMCETDRDLAQFIMLENKNFMDAMKYIMQLSKTMGITTNFPGVGTCVDWAKEDTIPFFVEYFKMDEEELKRQQEKKKQEEKTEAKRKDHKKKGNVKESSKAPVFDLLKPKPEHDYSETEEKPSGVKPTDEEKHDSVSEKKEEPRKKNKKQSDGQMDLFAALMELN